MGEEGEIFIQSLNKSFKLKREIGKLGKGKGPVLIFVGGMHGNEPTGVAALSDIFSEYADSDAEFNGTAYAFSGNVSALAAGQRYIDSDLNRLWFDEQISKIDSGLINGKSTRDEIEQVALR